jgi:hypothetical protein
MNDYSAEYGEALEAFRLVSAEHRRIADLYMAKRVSDTEFLASYKALGEANKAMDYAEKLEEIRYHQTALERLSL